ncbi:hypothetical protein BJ741DRAFT_606247 [Chytriomyces cf. hyalinus JEL632]|nr:hypothetical protein BJ741DRAFT_606247 [Chytriomyces cf. hyalinus JEL632]
MSVGTRSARAASKLNLREYFYQIDLQGALYLSDVKIRNMATAYRDPKFLDFFFSRLTLRTDLSSKNVSLKSEDFLYESRCGREINFIRSEDSPVVFQNLIEGHNNTHALLWGGTFKTPFHPDQVYLNLDNGRLYHPLPEALKAVPAPWQQVRKSGHSQSSVPALGLLKSSLVQTNLAQHMDSESMEWDGKQYALIPV